MNKNNTMNDVTEFDKLVSEFGAFITPTEEKAKIVISNIRAIVKQYVIDNNLQSLVIGISGGLDSSVVAAICQEKYIGVPLIGISIPMSSTNAHKEQAQWVGDNFCSAFEEFQGWDEDWDLGGEAAAYGVTTNMYSEVTNTVTLTNELAEKAGFCPKTFPTKVLDGNIKARLRMITLYDLARKTNGIVLSTDNLSEYQMGFWTICGDVGDFGPIQNIGKGFELPAIAKELGVRENIISQPPSDGLMVTSDNTDEAQLGANYKEVDTIMGIYLGEHSSIRSRMFEIMQTDTEDNIKISNIISRYKNLAYKRNGTINLTRNEIGI